MQKHLPNIAIVGGALIAGASLTYAIGRLVHLHLAGASTAALKLAGAQVTMFCLIAVPVGLVAIGGGWVWKRSNAEEEEARMAKLQRKRMKRPDTPGGKFAR